MELGKIVVLLALNLDRDESEITEDIAQRVREIQQQVECEFQFTLKAAVSEVLQGSESIRICYAQALQSLNYIHSSKGNSLIFFREVESRTTPALNFPVMEIVCLKEYLKNGNRAKLEQSIESICGKLLAEPYYSGDWVNAIFSNILYEVNTVWLEWGFSGKDIFGGEDLFVKLYSYESVEEKKAYLVNACVALMAYRADKEGNTQKLAVQRVIAYIEKNYDKTISLEIVAEEVGMNPSYLSTFFKKEVGIHFAEYIMTLRLKKALLLLGDGRLTVKQIAQECGYDTVHSFIRNFKKYYQVTPSEFRNQHSS
jgi:two-component system response regulator YesN